MGPRDAGRRAVLLFWTAMIAVLALSTATLAQASGGPESPGVRAEFSHSRRPSLGLLSAIAPATGGQRSLPAITGTVLTKYSSPTATTYELPDGRKVTRVYASPAAGGGEGGVAPLVSGYSPSCTLSNTAPTTARCTQQRCLRAITPRQKRQPGFDRLQNAQTAGRRRDRWRPVRCVCRQLHTTTATSMGAYRVSSEWVPGATWKTTNGTTAWHTAGGDFSTGAPTRQSIPRSVQARAGRTGIPNRPCRSGTTGQTRQRQGAANFGLHFEGRHRGIGQQRCDF